MKSFCCLKQLHRTRCRAVRSFFCYQTILGMNFCFCFLLSCLISMARLWLSFDLCTSIGGGERLKGASARVCPGILQSYFQLYLAKIKIIIKKTIYSISQIFHLPRSNGKFEKKKSSVDVRKEDRGHSKSTGNASSVC